MFQLNRDATFGEILPGILLCPSPALRWRLVLACALMALPGLLLRRRTPRAPGPLRWLMTIGLGLFCLLGLWIVLHLLWQMNLPDCSFDSASGQQLTLCIGDEEKVLR